MSFMFSRFCLILVISLFFGLEAPAATSCSTLGAQNTLVLYVTFPGTAGAMPSWISPTLTSYMYFGGDSGGSLNSYWQEASYGKTSVTGQVLAINLPNTYTLDSSGIQQMESDAVTAALGLGVNFQNYSRLHFIVPMGFDLGPSGNTHSGNLAGACTDLSYGFPQLPKGTYGTYVEMYTSEITNNAVYNTPRYVFLQVLTHEAGHSFGLDHSGSEDFGSEAVGNLGAQGSFIELNDNFDTMGGSFSGHYNAVQKAFLGWLDSSSLMTVNASGTYTLLPFESSASGLKTLKVQRGTGNNAYFWIEYRQPIGWDSGLFSQVFTGALIHYEDPFMNNYGAVNTMISNTSLLDFTPESTGVGTSYDGTDFEDAALAAGKSWTDPDTNLSINVVSATANGLTVTINYNANICSHAFPSISFNPGSATVSPGGTATFAVTVTNKDSPLCPANTISLNTYNVPTGFTETLSQSSFTLSPGQSAMTNLVVSVPTTATFWTYAIDLTAADPYATNIGAGSLTVSNTPAVDTTPPVISFTSPSNGSYVTHGTTVTMTASASDNTGVTKVLFYVGKNLLCTDTGTAQGGNVAATYSCNWSVPAKKGAKYTLQAVAYDAAGNSSSSGISVTSR